MTLKTKYIIYQLRCKMKKVPATDFIDFAFRSLFYREGVKICAR